MATHRIRRRVTLRRRLRTQLVLLLTCIAARGFPADQALIRMLGSDLSGGARDLYGSFHYGQADVNYIYASPTGRHCAMRATFSLQTAPPPGQTLHILGRNNDTGGPCAIEIGLNGVPVFSGPNPHPADAFAWRAFDIPGGTLRAGDNELTIGNLEPEGVVGLPPWFMVARVAIGPADLDLEAPVSIETEFSVALPSTPEPIPTPHAEGGGAGFGLRGTKGWLWRCEQYVQEARFMASHGLNFMMICYGSMWNIEGYADWPESNAWWLPLPEAKKAAYSALLAQCKELGIDLCLSINPNLSSSRPLDYSSAADLDALWQHYRYFQEQGMKWFCVSLDDISAKVDAAGQAALVNELLARLRAADPEARMIFCPTVYWGDGTGQSDQYGDFTRYLQTLASDLHPEVYLFWTGDAVVTPRITREAAQRFRDCSGHRLIIWDNYPVNDGNPTLHLGPLTGRDPDLPMVCDGYMSNPMHTQTEANRVPLLTCMDYACNPAAYDPARSIGQAILAVAPEQAQRQALADLVEMFPGMLIHGKGTGYNPVLDRYQTLLSTPHSRYLADLYLSHAEDVSRRLSASFPEGMTGARATLDKTLEAMRASYRSRYGADPRPTSAARP